MNAKEAGVNIQFNMNVIRLISKKKNGIIFSKEKIQKLIKQVGSKMFSQIILLFLNF